MQVQAESVHKFDGYQHPFIKPPASEVFNNVESSACFKKGSYIELSTGAMRRVEDIRTEDFIQSAVRSQLFDLKEATVVKIDRNSMHIIEITFSYDLQHSKINMQVSQAHPLFVYGQGWASCNPALSYQLYELKCQQLQVGDICLLLAKREYALPQQVYDYAAREPSNGNYQDVCKNHLLAPTQPNLVQHSYKVYVEMANLVAAYTQHMIDQIQS